MPKGDAVRRVSWLLVACAVQPLAAQERSPEFRRENDAFVATGAGYDARVARQGFRVRALRGGARRTPAVFEARLSRLGRAGASAGGAGCGEAVSLDRSRPDEVRVGYGSVTEIHQARRDGLEVSYLLDEIPDGEGDLVIRLAVEATDAAAVAGQKVEELWYGDPTSGIHVGAVTGIDAAGRRVRGWLRASAGCMELGLPADFVDSATLPVLVDPLVGPAFTTVSWWGGPGSSDAAVAYSSAADRYLIGYCDYNWLFFHQMVGGVLVDSAGGPPGWVYVGGAHLDDHVLTGLGYVRGPDAFFLLYGHVYGADWICSIDPTTAQIAYRYTGRQFTCCSASGDSRRHGDRFFVAGPGAVTAFSMGYTGVIKEEGRLTGLGTNCLQLSSHGGEDGRWLAVESSGSTLNGVVFAEDLSVLFSGPLVSGGAGVTTRREVHLDGDGNHWMLAYETSGAVGADLRCLPVFWDSSAKAVYTGSEALVARGATRPRVAFMGGSTLIAYARQFSGAVVTVDPFDAAIVEGPLAGAGPADVAGNAGWTHQVGDEALLQWSMGQWFRAADGVVQDLGGGCGEAGWIAASSAVAGNGGFALRLRDATPGGIAVALLSATGGNVPCGPCTVVPDLTAAVAAPYIADARGNAAVKLSLPVGVFPTFVAQWAVLKSAGAACSIGVDLTNAVSVTVG